MKTPTLRLASGILALSLGLAACSGGGEEAAPAVTPTVTETPTPTPTPTPEPTPEPVTGPPRPLNGLPADDETTLDQRVVAVKIDNHENARPQSGIDQADVVYELVVEAGLTRFIAMFHTASPGYVGPMRSGRPTDPTLILPSGNVFAISGAQDWVISRIRGAGVNLIGEVGRPQTFRIGTRRAPHNLFVDVAALRDLADERGYADAPPPELFTFAAWDDGTGTLAGDVLMRFSNSTTVTWRAEDDHYVRNQDGQPHLTVDRDGETSPLEIDTLVVLEAPLYTARPNGGGTPVPASDTVGTGAARVFHRGRVVEGTWTRDSAADVFTLTTFEGETLTVPPGRLWVAILPAGRTISW